MDELTIAEHHARAAEVGTTALVIRDHKNVLFSAERPSIAIDCRSIRKSPLGSLFGRHVHNGAINFDSTLAELGIDNSVPPSLSDEERNATIRSASRRGSWSASAPMPDWLRRGPGDESVEGRRGSITR